MLTGTADDIGMASVFKLLATARRTGRLEVVRPAGTATVFFDRGRIYHADSDLVPITLGERLVEMGVLGAEELRRAKDRSVTTGRALDEILQTGTGVDKAAMSAAVRAQMRAAAMDVITWEVGEFSWESGRVVAADTWVDLDVAELISETVEAEPELVHTAAAPPPPPPPPATATASTTTVPAPATPAPAEIHLAPVSIEDIEAPVPSDDVQKAGSGGLRLAPELAPVEGQTFSIALVCTGNRFRSPITQAMISARTIDCPLTIVSVGRHDARPGSALPEALEVARELGLDLSEHRARALTQRELKGFDLVLGFERAHVAEAIRFGGAPRDHAFTIMEFADLLSEIGPIRTIDPLERARLAVSRANDHRRLVRKYGTAVDLVDPIGQTIGAYRNSAAQITRLVDRLVAGLFGIGAEKQTSPAPFWRGA